MDELPRGWAKTTLGEICLPVDTIQPEATPNDNFTYIDIGSIDNQTNRIVRTKTLFGREAPSRARKAVKTNDILFSTVRTYLRNIARVEHDYPNPVASTGFAVVRPVPGVDPEFIFFQMLSRHFLEPLHVAQSGTSYPAVRDKDVFAQSIFLPPSSEQVRIVQKLKESFSRMAAGELAARRALRRLTQYRAAVLHAAVYGELTRDWRNENTSADTGENLLSELLRAHRNREVKIEIEDVQNSRKKADALQYRFKYEEPSPPKTLGLPALPRGWVWTNLGQLKSYSIYGPRFPKSDYSDAGVAILRTTDIDSHGRVSVETCPKIPLTDREYEKYKVEKGDLLITRSGSIGTLAIFNDTVRAVPGAYLLHYRLIDPALAEMVYMFLNSPDGQKRLWEESAGSGRQNLNMPSLESIAIPLPSLAEQKEISKQVNERHTAADRLEVTLTEQLDRAESRRESLLREAFAGRLVSQDPEDEPATVLLERIRIALADEAQKPKAKRMTKRRSKTIRRPILEVLREQEKPLTPEQIFHDAGFRPGEADLFYRELASLRERLKETKPSRSEVKQWPHGAKVLIELKEL